MTKDGAWAGRRKRDNPGLSSPLSLFQKDCAHNYGLSFKLNATWEGCVCFGDSFGYEIDGARSGFKGAEGSLKPFVRLIVLDISWLSVIALPWTCRNYDWVLYLDFFSTFLLCYVLFKNFCWETCKFNFYRNLLDIPGAQLSHSYWFIACGEGLWYSGHRQVQKRGIF